MEAFMTLNFITRWTAAIFVSCALLVTGSVGFALDRPPGAVVNNTYSLGSCNSAIYMLSKDTDDEYEIFFLRSSKHVAGGKYRRGTGRALSSVVSVADLEMCGLTDVTIQMQNTVVAGELSSGVAFYGIRFRAVETANGNTFDYDFSFSGVTNTVLTVSTTLVDTTAPTINIAPFTGAANGPQTAVITLSEDSTDFVLADLTLTNATATLSGSGSNYTAVLTPITDGLVELSVAAGTFTDPAANPNTAPSNTVATTVDLTPPTVSIAPFTGAANGPQTAVISLSEDSTDFVLADLTLTNATATLSGSGSNYTAVLTPITDGLVELSVAAGTFADAATNTNLTASNTVSATVDLTPPTVSIAPFTGAANGPQTAVITLSEDSMNFVLSDLTLTNATATLSGSGSNYTAVLTPITDGPVELSVAAGVFTDAATNLNVASSNTVTTTVDLTSPTVSIAPFAGATNGPQTAVITLSEDSTDFVLADLTLTNATATLSGSGSNYTAVLTPITDGPVELSVAAGTFTDASGNSNSAASNTVTTTFDGTAPNVTLSTTTTSFTGPTNFSVNVTFDEAVTGFDASDITVSNGSVTALTGTGSAYVATIAATGGGTVNISVSAAVATDIAGNDNTASNTLAISGAIVDETQRLIAEFQQARATQLISNQPDITEFLSSDGRSGALSAEMSDGAGTFNFVSKQGVDTSLWFRISGSVSNVGTADSIYMLGTVGHHFKTSPNLIFGTLLQFDYHEQDDGASNIKGKGWLLGPYFVAKHPTQPLFFDGRLLYGETSNDISPLGTFTDSFETNRILAQFKISGALSFGATTLRPSLQVSYTNDDQKAYTDGLGNLVPGQEIRLSQAEFGLSFSHFVPLDDRDAKLELTGGFTGIVSSTNGTAYTALGVPSSDGQRARINLGLNYTMANGGRLFLNSFYDGIGASGYESYGASVGLNVAF
jgi:hypothetical protein